MERCRPEQSVCDVFEWMRDGVLSKISKIRCLEDYTVSVIRKDDQKAWFYKILNFITK